MPAQQLTIDAPADVTSGEQVRLAIRMVGESVRVAAFNFDVVYDQRLVVLEAPEPALDELNTAGREFNCNLPPASGDVDPDPAIGRMRLVCFSFGGVEAEAPNAPLTLATVSMRGISSGTATLQFENVAVFTPDGQPVTVSVVPATVQVE